ncbi:branched-chain amino acid aminotransferase [Diplodia corticola]|uniref:Branched-chain amino acid aminotransferase n=1 Tax=Diplodia corticola TaxID=236234 RepID=A0A1J9R9H4_9PEZI|nr:branched-chain amino acid aminotransferase [Diplodia corticola]OJD36834.1 branched-chain amino acid aminotransferase [Diplodia corticola]
MGSHNFPLPPSSAVGKKRNAAPSQPFLTRPQTGQTSPSTRSKVCPPPPPPTCPPTNPALQSTATSKAPTRPQPPNGPPRPSSATRTSASTASPPPSTTASRPSRASRPSARPPAPSSSSGRAPTPRASPPLFLRAVRLAVALNSAFVPPRGNGAALYVRPLAFAAGAAVDMAPPSSAVFCVFVLPVAPLPAGKAGSGLRALVVEKMDRAAPRGTGGAKVGGNYGAAVAVMRDAKAEGFGLTLFLDSATRTVVDEFSASGFVGVRREGGGGVTLVVPTGAAILKSITVDSVCRIAESFGWQVERRAVLYSELAGLSEAFAVGTAFIITPVRLITRKIGVFSSP